MNLCIFTYVHTETRMYIQTQENKTQKLAESISQENSFKVYFKKGNLRHFTCFITL